MKKIYKLGMLWIAGALAISSCSLDEVNPNNSGQTSDGAYTLETYKGFVNACYTALINNIYQSSDYLVCTEAGTDIWEEPSRGNSWYQRYHSYKEMRTDDSYYYKVWQFSYKCINNCNIVIDGASNVSASPEEIEQCVAQARCLRAFYYMNLVEQFGKIDLQLQAQNGQNVSFEAHRSEIPDIYATIVEDLKYAVEKLPVEFSDYYSRVTKKTAKGLLARAYINGAGYDLKDSDGKSYLEKAYDTAKDMIDHQTEYGWYMYSDFADVFNENNNRNNKEALFIASGARRYSSGYTDGNYTLSEMFRHFLPKFKPYTDLGFEDKKSNMVYGRPNSEMFLPSKYLMDCFAADENDTRFRYSFISAYSSFSVNPNQLGIWSPFCNWDAQGNRTTGKGYDAYDDFRCSKEITAELARKYGIPESNIGKHIYPHFVLEAGGSNYDNYGQLGIWNKEGTDYELQKVGTTAGNIFHPELPLDPEIGHQYAIYCSLKTLTEEEKAQYPGLVLNIFDLYGEDGISRANYDKPSVGSQLWLLMYPALSKYNMPGDEFIGKDCQTKTIDAIIMRMAEVYLIAAEASVRLGKGDAYTYINELRTRANAKPVGQGEVTMDYVFDEYARELCGECGRWYLLKRNHAFETRLAKYNKRAAAQFKSDYYVRPIPSKYLQAISNPEEFGQNSGY